MIPFSQAVRRSVAALALSFLAGALPGAAAPVPRSKAHTPAQTPARGGIIALPLQPIVPVAQRGCAARTASGLGYTVLRPASGAKPAASDVALVNYIGYLSATGAVFDQAMSSPLQVDGVIPGFAEGLKMLAKTGIVRLCIPAALGYGAKGSGPIPGNADLVFQIELLDYRTAAEVETLRRTQPAEPAGE